MPPSAVIAAAADERVIACRAIKVISCRPADDRVVLDAETEAKKHRQTSENTTAPGFGRCLIATAAALKSSTAVSLPAPPLKL